MKIKQILLILTMCIGTFLCMLDTTVMNIALPAIQSSMNVPLTSLSWALNIYTITFAALTIPLSRLADIWGRNKIYLVGLLIFASGSFVSGMANVPTVLIIGRGIQSIGAAIVFPTSMTIAIDTIDQKHRSKALLTIGLTQGLAATLGPTIGGVVTQFMGWRWVFYINLPLVVLAIVGVILQLPLGHEKKIDVKIDVGGMISLMVTLFSLALGLTQGNDWGWMNYRIISLTLITIVSFIIFIIIEKRVTDPMIRLDLFKNRQFSGSALTVVLAGLLLVAVMVIMPTFFTQVQGKTELIAALLITPASLMIFLVSPITGIIVEKFGPRLIIFIGFLSMSMGYAVLGFVNSEYYWQILLGLILIGFGYGTVIGPITVLAASDFKGEKLSASQSVMGVLRQIGNIIAVAIFVSMLTTNVSKAKENAWTDAQKLISTSELTSTSKKDMLKVTHSHFESSDAKTNGNDEKGISETKEQRLIQANVAEALRKAKISQLSDQQGEQVKEQITSEVTNEIKEMVKKDNRIINRDANKISKNANHLISKAFLSLYFMALPFTIMFIPVCLLFYKRDEYKKILMKSKRDIND